MSGLEVKFAGPGDGLRVDADLTITGYASVFGQVDQGGDRVAPGAFAAGLDRLAAAGRRVKMLWQHDPARPIGVWDSVVEDATGLQVRGRLLPDLAQGREAAALIEAGAIDGLSIGYRTVKSVRDGAVRVLTEVELWEVSLVTFPMLPQARVGAKAGEGPDWQALISAVRAAQAELGA